MTMNDAEGIMTAKRNCAERSDFMISTSQRLIPADLPCELRVHTAR